MRHYGAGSRGGVTGTRDEAFGVEQCDKVWQARGLAAHHGTMSVPLLACNNHSI